MNARSVSGKPG